MVEVTQSTRSGGMVYYMKKVAKRLIADSAIPNTNFRHALRHN